MELPKRQKQSAAGDGASRSTGRPTESTATKGRRLRFLRLVTLISLMLSDGTYTVLRRYSQGVLQETYSVNEVLLFAEVIKLLFSTCMIVRKRNAHDANTGGDATALLAAEDSIKGEYVASSQLSTHLFNLLLKSRKMLVLAATYGLGNVLSYYALARVGAGTFVVIANLKTLTTAAFSTLLLRRTYSWTKWRALILLVCGVVLFVLPTLEDAKQTVSSSSQSDAVLVADASGRSGAILGCGAELIVITLSGFAAIYFEGAIKNDPFDIWERNFQLGMYSILMYVFMIVTYGRTDDSDARFLANWTPLAVALSFLGATGGLLVALSIKYGDSVLKTLAISGSIVYASVVDYALLHGPLTGQMSISGVVVIIAIINYTFDSTPADETHPRSTVAGTSTEESNVEDLMVHDEGKKDMGDGWGDNDALQPLVNRRS